MKWQLSGSVFVYNRGIKREVTDMKKLICLLLAFSLLCAGTCFAGEQNPVWKVRKLSANDWNADFDGDGDFETLSVSFDLNEYGDGAFTLDLDGQSFTKDGCAALNTDVYAMNVGYDDYYYGTLLFMSEYGMSDDLLTYCYFYTEGKLMDVGMIPDNPNHFRVSTDGVITADVRARRIGTWNHPEDYILAKGFHWDENGDPEQYYAVCRVPRDTYPMGMIVTAKVELPLLASRFDAVPTLKIPADTKVILASCDDVSWLCVSSMDGSIVGYLRFTTIEYGEYFNIGNKKLAVDDVFADIFYAD